MSGTWAAAPASCRLVASPTGATRARARLNHEAGLRTRGPLPPPLKPDGPFENSNCTKTKVRAGLLPLIASLKSRGTRPDDAWLAGDYDTKAQAALCEEVALDMGGRGAEGAEEGAS